MKLVLLLSVLMVLSACASLDNGVVVRNVQHQPFYSPDIVHWAGAGRDIRLVMTVPGKTGDAQPLSEATTSAVASMPWLPFRRVTDAPDGSERDNFHLAIVLDAPETMAGKDACAGTVEPSNLAPVSGQSHILFAFCNDARIISTAHSVVPAVSSPSDPNFARAVTAAVTEAIPLRDPNRVGNGREPFLAP